MSVESYFCVFFTDEVITVDDNRRISHPRLGDRSRNIFANMTTVVLKRPNSNSHSFNSINSISGVSLNNRNISISPNSISGRSTKMPPKMALMSSRRIAPAASLSSSTSLTSLSSKSLTMSSSSDVSSINEANRKRRRGRKSRKELERSKRKSTGIVGPYPIVPQGELTYNTYSL